MAYDCCHEDRATHVELHFGLAPFFLAIALAVLGLGCEPTPIAVPPAPPISTPQSKLEWAMERLERALEEFQPPQSVGLRMKRSMAYEFIPVDPAHPHPTALVTIESKTMYLPDEPVQQEDKQEEEEEPAFEPIIDPEEEDNGLPPLRVPKVRVQEPLTAAPSPSPSIESRTTYELNFIDDRWQLQSEVESESERNWFEYALMQ